MPSTRSTCRSTRRCTGYKLLGFEAESGGVQAVAEAPGTYGFVVLFPASGALELALWTPDPNKEVGGFGE